MAQQAAKRLWSLCGSPSDAWIAVRVEMPQCRLSLTSFEREFTVCGPKLVTLQAGVLNAVM